MHLKSKRELDISRVSLQTSLLILFREEKKNISSRNITLKETETSSTKSVQLQRYSVREVNDYETSMVEIHLSPKSM